jgi:hypothetical protein
MVRTGDNVMIGGFIITGSTSKKIIVRAMGPSLTQAGVSGAMANPKLELRDSRGRLLASNTNWETRRAEILATGLPPTNPNEAAAVATLAPGAYTVVVSGVNNTSGVALFELYDLDVASSNVANISTRGRVEPGDHVMIGGFIIGGDQPTRVIIRAMGPSLTQSGLTGVLADPILALHDANGSLIFTNDNWRSTQQQQIIDSGLPPTDNRESAIIATLQPGNYTAIVSGSGNTSGVALVEVYNLDR